MPEFITVLQSKGLNLCKVWKADGTIVPYSNSKWFTYEQVEVANIDDLSKLLSRLEQEPTRCIIRAMPKHEVAQPIRRLIENVIDGPLCSLLIEVDDFRPLLNNPVTEPQDSAIEFITECLPPCFHDASFHWQMSNSAGAPGNEGLLKAHIWWWLSTPYDSATLRAWATAENLQLDKSVLNPVQVNYTAAPVFESGRVDPVPVRSGLYRGLRDDVDLYINTEGLDIRHAGVRQRGEHREIEDPLADFLEQKWETWGELTNGGILCSCPFDDDHSGGGRGDSSTVYFPSGSNGYSEGRWVCLHNSCHDRPQGEFNAACGYVSEQFAALAVKEPPYINGHVINDALLLPPFRRTLQGGIKVVIGNVCSALRTPHVSRMRLRYDLFKDGVVCAAEHSETWRPFLDKDYTDLRVRLESLMEGIGREMIRDAVHAVAQENAFDTGIEWLQAQTWDGVPRVETFWSDHFGTLDTPYVRAVALYTWSALAGRVLQPGVQADMVPILVGPQGLRKSRGIMAMAPAEEFATTMSFHEPEVERARKMRGRMVVELAELQGLKSREREEILAWVTRSGEHWTPKYMEMTTTFRRRFLMFGTTNARDFLDDPSGERRWLPIDVGATRGFEMVDTERLAAERDQLWAEAAMLFTEHGIMWHRAELLARDIHADYKAEDAWAQAVTAWLDRADMASETPRSKRWLTIAEVAEGALSMPPRMMKFTDQRRLGKVLRDEGYEPTPRKVDGKSVKVWAPVRFV